MCYLSYRYIVNVLMGRRKTLLYKKYGRQIKCKCRFIVQMELETFLKMTFPRDIEEIFLISTGNEPEKAIFIRIVLETTLYWHHLKDIFLCNRYWNSLHGVRLQVQILVEYNWFISGDQNVQVTPPSLPVYILDKRNTPPRSGLLILYEYNWLVEFPLGRNTIKYRNWGTFWDLWESPASATFDVWKKKLSIDRKWLER